MAIRKLGRNDPCWCGSGKKYKRCHLERDRQEPISVWDFATEAKKAFGKRQCMCPASYKDDCDGKIVKAHTIPKSKSLKKLIQKGHLYQLVSNLHDLVRQGGRLSPKLVGLKDASTFTGFCAYHDNSIFGPLEKHSFIGSEQQYFLLAYRALCRELFCKNAALSLIKSHLREADRGKDIHSQLSLQATVNAYQLGTEKGIRDMSYYKAKFDKILTSNSYTDMHSYIIYFGAVPDVMCSCGIFPEYDFQGNTMQDLANIDAIPHSIQFTLMASDFGGAMVFSWLAECDSICTQFVSSLNNLDDGDIPSAIVRLIFEYCENTFFSRSWWEGLSQSEKDQLLNRISTSATLDLERSPKCLCDDGLRTVNWRVSDKVSNF